MLSLRLCRIEERTSAMMIADGVCLVAVSHGYAEVRFVGHLVQVSSQFNFDKVCTDRVSPAETRSHTISAMEDGVYRMTERVLLLNEPVGLLIPAQTAMYFDTANIVLTTCLFLLSADGRPGNNVCHAWNAVMFPFSEGASKCLSRTYSRQRKHKSIYLKTSSCDTEVR